MEKFIFFKILWILKMGAASWPYDPSYINIAGYPGTPNCHYESCHNSSQCGATPVRMNPNLIHAFFTCFCDSSCLLYGDCCFDYFENCLGSNISDFSQSDKYKNMESTFLKEKKALQNKTCSGIEKNLFWTVRSCSGDSVTDEDVLNCEVGRRNAIGGVPVTLIDNPTITFANYYCAKCHGFDRNMVRFWNTSVECNNSIDFTNMSFTQVEKLILLGTCWVQSSPNPEDKPRLCYKNITNLESKTHGALTYGKTSTESSDPDLLKPMITGLMSPTYFIPPLVTTIPPEIYLEEADKLCSLYVYPVKVVDSTMYQNPHCALSVLGSWILDTPLRCGVQRQAPGGSMQPGAIVGGTMSATTAIYPTPQGSKGTMSNSVNSFNMLFNFGENEMSLDINGRVVRTETRLCLREDEVFNIYSHKCVTLLCDGMDMHPVNGTCILKDKQLMDGTRQLYPHGAHSFTITLGIRGKDTLMRKFVKKKMKRYFERFLSDRIDISNNMNVNITILMKRVYAGVAMKKVTHVTKLATYTYTANVESNAQVSSLINATGCLFRQLSIQLSHHNVKAFDFSLNNYERNYAYTLLDDSELDEDGNNSTEVCPEEHVPKMFPDVELISVRDYYYARLNRTYFRLDNIGFEMHYEDREAVPSLVDIIVCVPDLGNESLHCPNGKLSIHQSEFSLVNDSLRYIPSGAMLSPGNFSLTRHGAIICSHFSRSHTDQVAFFDYSNVQVVLTIATSSVSMASLVVVLLVYSFLPQLRNVPGKIVMSLSATLLVAQGLQLMTKVPTGQMCVAVASLVHMMWLSTFLWMSLLSVDLARSLRSMSPLSGTQNHNKLLCLYACIGWGIPFLLVVICVVVDRFHVWGIIIGYGSDHMCWIANPKASLYVFGLPLALTLLINVTCFILTLISIERTASKVSPHSKSCKNEKKRLGIYVRLSFIMGFSWIFCFIAAFAHVSLLWYFQIVLNGLQGFYIFVCFVCKSRTFKLLVEKLYCLHKKDQSRGTNVTNTS